MKRFRIENLVTLETVEIEAESADDAYDRYLDGFDEDYNLDDGETLDGNLLIEELDR
jgi:hypothetical protein